MARKGKDFELEYKRLYNLDKTKYKIMSPAFLYDPFAERKREIDILVEYEDKDKVKRKMAIECRDRKNVQDVIWIEQLQQKKEDLSLDYILATTTSDFTKSAINKAKKHGIILEKAETFNVNSISEILENEFFMDVYFFKFTIMELNFLMKDKKIVPFKKFMEQLNILERIELINFLNKDFFYSIDPNLFFRDGKISEEDFFHNDKDNSIEIRQFVDFFNNSPQVISNNGVISLVAKIKITPFKLSLPLNKSLSVFQVGKKKNKNYCAIFGNESDYVEVGYIENKKYAKIHFKKREYLRLAGGTMHLNTIFPDISSNLSLNWEDIHEKYLGKFDFSKVD